MAGTYPDIPGQRFPLDQDGTRLFLLDNGLTVATNVDAQLATVADTDTDSWYVHGRDAWGAPGRQAWFAVVFPEKRDLTGYFVALTGQDSGSYELQYSPDSTDGINGTWSTLVPNFARHWTVRPNNRLNITGTNLPGIQALRFGVGYPSDGQYAKRVYLEALHLFGNITAGENPDRLRFWRPAEDAEVSPAHFDFGNVVRGRTYTKTFRVKNNSTTLTANAVTLARSSPSMPEMATGLAFSADGTTWVDSLPIGDLAPGALSPVITLRRVVATDEAVGYPKDGRISAAATTWT